MGSSAAAVSRRPAVPFSTGLIFFLVFAALANRPAPAQSPETSVTLAFESQCFDLDAGGVLDGCAFDEERVLDWDVKAAHHSDREPHAVLVSNEQAGVEIAYLQDVPYSGVTKAHVKSASFVSQAVDRAFDGSFVILVRTDTGSVFKLGLAVEEGATLSFEFEELIRTE